MNIKLSFLAATIAVAGLSACGGGSDGLKLTNNDGQKNELVWVTRTYEGPTVVTSTDRVTGTGAEALAGKSVTVKLSQWQYNASAPEFKGAAVGLPGASQTLTLAITAAPGLADAVLGMKVGGTRTAVIPGDMRTGYWISSLAAAPVLLPAQVAEIELLAVN